MKLIIQFAHLFVEVKKMSVFFPTAHIRLYALELLDIRDLNFLSLFKPKAEGRRSVFQQSKVFRRFVISTPLIFTYTHQTTLENGPMTNV